MASLRLFLLAAALAGPAQEIRPGVWAGRDLGALPLPASGYEVYLLGEMHGVKETEGILAAFLARLHDGMGLRDVAIEEDGVYQRDAQAYVEARASAVPQPLCLRAGVLQAIRRFNEERKDNKLVRVHLIDIDMPATAISRHLAAIKERVAGAAALRMPAAGQIKMFWTAKDASLAGGETLDRVLAANPEVRLLYIDPKRQRARLPSQDLNTFAVDAFLLLANATPMEDHCVPR